MELLLSAPMQSPRRSLGFTLMWDKRERTEREGEKERGRALWRLPHTHFGMLYATMHQSRGSRYGFPNADTSGYIVSASNSSLYTAIQIGPFQYQISFHMLPLDTAERCTVESEYSLDYIFHGVMWGKKLLGFWLLFWRAEKRLLQLQTAIWQRKAWSALSQRQH